tara:strand:+ start:822 stop:1280 length:459 start_codon:yes stop_codon:yes gene_type:complete
MLSELNYKFRKKKLRDEALYADGYVSFNDPLTKKDIPEWSISKTIGCYSKSITSDFKKLLQCEVSPRYYIQEKGFTLPFHKDRGTQCCINFVLSDIKDPIEFRSKSYSYECALINVQEEHKVSAITEDRVLFKLSIFDMTYNEALNKISGVL